MKFFHASTLAFILLSLPASSSGAELKLNFDSPDLVNVEILKRTIEQVSLERKQGTAIEIEFDNLPRLYQADWKDIEAANYPHGDFHFLTGNLTDSWTSSDYARFYSVAKWLAKRGLRPVINPVAYILDAREAAQNPKTAAILWNSHGDKTGYVLDSNDKPLPKDIFVRNRSPRFKYLLFASCYGYASITYYQMKGIAPALFAYGWPGETTSTMLFEHLFSDTFDKNLEAALGVKLERKSGADI
jgi:hypothetical protein